MVKTKQQLSKRANREIEKQTIKKPFDKSQLPQKLMLAWSQDNLGSEQ